MSEDLLTAEERALIEQLRGRRVQDWPVTLHVVAIVDRLAPKPRKLREMDDDVHEGGRFRWNHGRLEYQSGSSNWCTAEGIVTFTEVRFAIWKDLEANPWEEAE